ncbi:MAG: hypothetical protein P4L10_00530 [Acidobacteriaceae bacterium]|jgi:hypothetical protein|nr:hypothetical protein [Acidobacteriaceae bacterium]
MSFALYLAGFLIVLSGFVYGEHLAHMPEHWIIVVALILAGLGVLTGVKNTRQKDPS